MKIVILSAVFVAVVSGMAPMHRVRPSQRIPDSYIIRFKESAARVDVLRRVVSFAWGRNIKMDVTKVFYHVMPGIAAKIPDDRIEEIRSLEEVDEIYEDGLVTTAEAQKGVSWGLDRLDQRDGMAAFDGIYDPKGSII
ncbi:subtilisin-like serine protease Pen c 2 [Patiria miniata]|uniref:Inhibitor I9 domain-containing protein n=1 Tax=Patiria miniata TaxID=46514 RepID=A0A913ZRE7_PATMI|nr:subtilisin-like serine protease Pen c 2 [Patiria miniata]